MVNEGGMVKWWEMQIKWVSRLCQPSTNPVKDNFLLSIKGEKRGKTQEHWDRKRWRAAERKKKYNKKKNEAKENPPGKMRTNEVRGACQKIMTIFPPQMNMKIRQATTTAKGATAQDLEPLLAAVNKD